MSSIQFLLNDRRISTTQPAGLSVLDYLRSVERLTGTKESCREGDCGSCMVLLGEAQDGHGVRYQPVNACLLPLGEVHAKHLVSIEGLNGAELSPIQRALVAAGAVQCGYCTPGLVVGLTGFFLSAAVISLPAAIEAVSGTLCRCTGYVAVRHAVAELCRRFSMAHGASPAERRTQLVNWGIVPAYFHTIPGRLQRLPVKEACVPRPDAVLIAGGTDLFAKNPEHLIEAPLTFLSGRPDLKRIWTRADRCYIGAATTVEELRHSPELRQFFPEFDCDLRLICSTPIRHRATLGGNLVNGSPVGDLIVFFLALRATLGLEGSSGPRQLALQDFYADSRRAALGEQEILQWVSFERPAATAGFSFEKVSKRQHLDVASVNSAMSVNVVDGLIQEIGLSAGGVAPTPLFLANTVDYLTGKTPTAQHIRAAAAVAQEETDPIDDLRGSANYKRLLLRQLIHAHFLKLCPDTVRPEELQCQ